ncbi:MAG: pilus assembly PilX N-terminal domain-containing protein [Candidatus Aminicenantes bacterium]
MNKKINKEKGVGLIIVILLLAFMLGTGMVLMTVTSSGSKVAGNIRSHQEAFNSAEAGFDAAWSAINDAFSSAQWISFDDHYLSNIEIPGFDIPQDPYYFRKLTDEEILNIIDSDGDGSPDVSNVLFCRQPFLRDENGEYDLRYTYTAFLIDDEAVAGTPDAGDALLVCIGTAGTGSTMSTSRLEIELAIEVPGT